MTEATGRYIYCIIKKPQNSFGIEFFGVGGGWLYVIHSGKLAAVVSDSPMMDYPITRENTVTHQRAIEEVMQVHAPVLPVSFGTIAENESLIKEKILKAKQNELLAALNEVDGKIELNLKAIWLDMPKTFQKVVSENSDLARLKREIVGKTIGRDEAIEIGKLVAAGVESKRETIKGKILSTLDGVFADYKETPLLGDEMIFNISFLIPGNKQKHFDSIVRNLDKQYEGDSIYFKYIGPMPPFDFVKVPVSFS